MSYPPYSYAGPSVGPYGGPYGGPPAPRGIAPGDGRGIAPGEGEGPTGPKGSWLQRHAGAVIVAGSVFTLAWVLGSRLDQVIGLALEEEKRIKNFVVSEEKAVAGFFRKATAPARALANAAGRLEKKVEGRR